MLIFSTIRAAHVRAWTLWLAALTASFLAGGCDGSRQQTPQGASERAARRFTEQELEALVRPGIRISEITNVLGTPWMVQTNADVVELNFLFSILGATNSTDIGGVRIYTTDGRVISWLPVVVESSHPAVDHETFFIADEKGADAELLAAMAHEGQTSREMMRDIPGVEFKARVFRDYGYNGAHGEARVGLVVRKADARKLTDWTSVQNGRSWVILWHGRVIARSEGASRPNERQIVFETSDSEFLNIAN